MKKLAGKSAPLAGSTNFGPGENEITMMVEKRSQKQQWETPLKNRAIFIREAGLAAIFLNRLPNHPGCITNHKVRLF
jgi:hypothetical protein